MGIVILVLIGVLIDAIIRKNKLASTSTASNEGETSYVLNDNGELVEATSVDSNSSETSNNSDNATTSTTANSSETGNSNTSAEAGNLAPVSDTATASVTPSSDVKSDNPVVNTSAGTSSMPKTGPESLFGLALLLGSVATFLVSRRLAVL